MIDERTAELLVERLIRRIEQANTYFLMKMGASIKQIRNLTPSQAQQLVQILKYGGNYEKIIKEISKYTGLNIKNIDDIFSTYAKKDQLFYKKFYEYRNKPFIPFDQNPALKTQTMALSNIAKTEMFNFTRSNVLGYTIKDTKGRIQFLGLRETYNRVLDEAFLNVGQGKETFDSAMTRIMKELGGSGLKTIEYESGRSMRLDSAVQMHLKARLRELHNENQKIFGEEFDYDGIEISVHSNPAPDHELAQGRQFTVSEYDENGNLIKEGEFEKLQAGKQAITYDGLVVNLDHDHKNGYRPISELNCYHYVFSIVLGVSKPEYTNEQLQKIIDDNKKGFEYEGKHYTMYEGEQLQRRLERKIREQKDIQIMAKASGNEELILESQTKITQLTNKYKELSSISGLPTKMERMRVSGYRRIAVNKNKINNNKNTLNLGKYRDFIDNTSVLPNLDSLDYKGFMSEYDKWYDSLDKKEVQKVYKNYEIWCNNEGETTSHPIGNYLNKKFKYDAKPQLIEEKEFWIDEDGESALRFKDTTLLDKDHWFRGIVSMDKINNENVVNIEKTKKYVNDFKYGDYFAGSGVNGNGTYTTNSFDYAYRFSMETEEGIMYLMPKDNVKIIPIEKINRIKYNLLERIPKKDDLYSNFANAVLGDNGYVATLLGYDIIDVGPHKIILNRGSIKVVK